MQPSRCPMAAVTKHAEVCSPIRGKGALQVAVTSMCGGRRPRNEASKCRRGIFDRACVWGACWVRFYSPKQWLFRCAVGGRRQIMKKLINDPRHVVREMLLGVVAVAPETALLETENVVVRADLPPPDRRGVAIISGGGAGH